MMHNWTRLMAVMFVGSIAACGDDTDGTTDDDTETEDTETDTVDTDGACNPGIKTPTLPANGAQDVFFQTDFAISFQQKADDTTTFSLAADGGSAVTLGTVAWSTDGKNAAFKASTALEPSTAYTLTVTYSCNDALEPKIQFSTDSTGTPIDPTDFEGKKYALDLATATIIEPAGVQSLLGQLLGQLEDAIIIVPKDYTDPNITFFGGLAAIDGSGMIDQDTCTETIVFPETADFSENPLFVVSAPDGVTLAVSGVSIELLSLELSGAFNPDASAMVGVRLAGSIDTRSIADLLGEDLGAGEGDDAVCVLLGQLTGGLVSCEECPDSAGPYCLSLVAANIKAESADGEFVEILELDPSCTVE